MIVVISSTGTDQGSAIDPRFGRCAYYMVYDMEQDNYKAVENQSRNATGGAGIQAAQTVADMDAGAVITTNIGPNAFRVLDSAGIKVYSGVSGTVKDAIEDYKKGSLGTSKSPNVGDKFGMGSGQGRGGIS